MEGLFIFLQHQTNESGKIVLGDESWNAHDFYGIHHRNWRGSESMKETQHFKEVSFPDSRISTIDVSEIGRKKHHMVALLEIDVTDARAVLKEIRDPKGKRLSFTAWLVKCVGAAVSEYPEAAAFLKSHKSMLVFDDVDVSITVEKEINGYKVPLPLVIRNVTAKSILDIHNEISAAQNQDAKEGTVVLGSGFGMIGLKLFYALPAFLRRWIWKAFLLKPHTAQKLMGSVMLTSVGMIGPLNGWIIPTSIHPLCLAVGGIVKKPGVFKDTIAIREYLMLTALVDHDVIDGAPAARFIARLDVLLKTAYGLDSV